MMFIFTRYYKHTFEFEEVNGIHVAHCRKDKGNAVVESGKHYTQCILEDMFIVVAITEG